VNNINNKAKNFRKQHGLGDKQLEYLYVLKPKYQLAVSKRFFGGKTYAAISKEIGLSTNRIRQMCVQAVFLLQRIAKGRWQAETQYITEAIVSSNWHSSVLEIYRMPRARAWHEEKRQEQERRHVMIDDNGRIVDIGNDGKPVT